MAASELIPWINSAGEGGVRNSMQEFPGAGTNGPFEFNFAGGYIDQSYVKAYRYDPVSAATYDQTLTFVGTNTVTTSDVIPTGQFVIVYRDTPKDKPLVDFTDGAVMDEENLDLSNQQAISVAAEMLDRFDSINATSSDAINRSVLALNTANTALANSQAAQAAAANAVSTAGTASGVASDAQSKAAAAVTTANGIDAKASTALSNSQSAVSTANAAASTANGIDSKAQTALDNSNSAVSTANTAASNASTALSTANGIDSKASTALSNSQTALSAANNAMQNSGGEFTGPVKFDVRPTFNGATPFDTSNFFDPQGYCYLSYTSSSLLTLSRKNGRTLPINGRACLIPAAGVTCSATGTAASTLHYIYAVSSDGINVTGLEYSTTGWVYDANYGIASKSGDATRSLVGMAFVATAGEWLNSGTTIALLSYYQRAAKTASNTNNAGQSSVATAWTGCDALNWPDESTRIVGYGTASMNVSNAASAIQLRVDGSTYTYGLSTGQANSNFGVALTGYWEGIIVNSGYHSMDIYGVPGGGVMTMTCQLIVTTRG